MTDVIDLDNLDRAQVARGLVKIAAWMGSTCDIQIPLRLENGCSDAFDPEEKLPNGLRRWLAAKEAAPILGCSIAAVYARVDKDDIGIRVGKNGSKIWIDRLKIPRMK
ncbi:hypothetical protein [Rhizobium leguminosarum]|uniref:hypothetical protein n=1 Tax=Rhizobium leguminosarum TaxID=384 RepID=UPI001030D1B0|nr:hypothetical protein [Rhizobium leguminosarum]TBG03775.1 hypothetical protein ELG82_09590 [Rhizobium leguminosarum]